MRPEHPDVSNRYVSIEELSKETGETVSNIRALLRRRTITPPRIDGDYNRILYSLNAAKFEITAWQAKQAAKKAEKKRAFIERQLNRLIYTGPHLRKKED